MGVYIYVEFIFKNEASVAQQPPPQHLNSQKRNEGPLEDTKVSMFSGVVSQDDSRIVSAF